MATQAELDVLLCPREYVELPVKVLTIMTRLKLAKYLDKKGKLIQVELGNIHIDILNDFTGLAKLADQDESIITNTVKRQEKNSSTMELLDLWSNDTFTVGKPTLVVQAGDWLRPIIHYGVAIGKFWDYLLTLERHDVIDECRPLIVSDCQAFLDTEKKKEENYVRPPVYYSEGIERGGPQRPEADHRIEYTYDAFVCYNQDDPEDKRFVDELIEELEGRRRLRLYVPGRDDLTGASEQINNAEQIERRCRIMLTVMSRSLLQSPINDFQERYAQVVGRKRLITIIREEGVVMPRIQAGRNTYDLTNTDIGEIWARLTKDLRALIGPEIYLGLNSFQYLRDQRFPMPADANDQTRPKLLPLPRNVQTPSLRESPVQLTSDITQNSRTDLQRLLKTRKTDVLLVPNETPYEKEEETIPKQVELKKDNTDTKMPEQLVYQIQPTTTVSQNPTPSQANEINSSHETAQMFEDQTSRITLNQPSTSASLTSDQRTETPNAENEKPREPNEEDYLFDSK